VFWHWPREGVDLTDYEPRLLAFHTKLAANSPAGMRRSMIWRVSGAPWLPDGAGYEDWYLLEDTSALGTIGGGVTSGFIGDVHSAVAQLAAGGTAGLYQPATRPLGDVSGSTALWFPKPDGMRYEELYARLGDDAGRLWMRMLVLGPTPEMCLLTDQPEDLPSGVEAIVVRRERLWP
jgi:hypothetical protein